MRLGEKRLLYIRKSREKKHKFSAFLIVLLILMLAIYLVVYFLESVRPMMVTLDEAKAKQIAQQAINEAVLKVFASNGTDVSDVLVFEKTADGQISAVKSNLEGVNRLKAEITMMIQENISNIETTDIRLPLGMLLGTDFFAGVGPRFSVEFVPYGTTSVEFVSEFEDAGINQTRLTVELDVKTSVGLLMTGVNEGVYTETKVPVIQTVIVGDVPDTYTNVERNGEEFEDDVLEIAG